MLTLVIIGLIAGFGGAILVNSPDLQKALGLQLGGETVDAATTAIEKDEDEYNRLLNELPNQRKKVALVMANAELAKEELRRRETRLAEIARNYQRARGMGVPKDRLLHFGEQFTTAQEQFDRQKVAVSESQTLAQSAQQILNDTDKALRKFKDQLQDNKARNELANALRINAKALQDAKDIMSGATSGGSATAAVDEELEKARARVVLAKGSEVEQELAGLKQATAAERGQAELEALFAPETEKSELDVLVSGKAPAQHQS